MLMLEKSFYCQSASWSVIVVGLTTPMPSFLKIDKGIRLILAPRSQSALAQKESSMLQGIMKLLGSFNFGDNFPWTN